MAHPMPGRSDDAAPVDLVMAADVPAAGEAPRKAPARAYRTHVAANSTHSGRAGQLPAIGTGTSIGPTPLINSPPPATIGAYTDTTKPPSRRWSATAASTARPGPLALRIAPRAQFET